MKLTCEQLRDFINSAVASGTFPATLGKRVRDALRSHVQGCPYCQEWVEANLPGNKNSASYLAGRLLAKIDDLERGHELK